MADTEAAFSARVVRTLRELGWFVQRIESGTTGRGIPDIYCVTPDGTPVWIELKRVHIAYKRHSLAWVGVPWRPGQQNWMRRIHTYGQSAITLIKFDDCVGYVDSGAYRYEENRVPTGDIRTARTLRDLIGTPRTVRDRRRR